MEEGEEGQQGCGVGGILALSGGVFAFSLTLVVVSLSVPTAASNSTLASQLADEAPTFFSYIISFVAVPSIWYGHPEAFQHPQPYDAPPITRNFRSLLLLPLLPLPPTLLRPHPQHTSP